MDTSNESIRLFLLDRSVEDNEIDLQLFFSDDEINGARERAVAHFNEIPPYSVTISLSGTVGDSLPRPMMFLNGIAYFAHLSKLMKLQKEDLDYNAGGMSVELVKRRIAHLSNNLTLFKQEFENLATNYKLHINYNSSFGSVG
jgi:hypothetical protein